MKHSIQDNLFTIVKPGSKNYYFHHMYPQVQQVDTITNVEFILLDCSNLKFSIIAHCDEWQNRFHDLLLEMASTKLSNICTSLKENSKK